MPKPALLVVTGLPASGKSTLVARLLAQRPWSVLSKDSIKEALFDVLRDTPSRPLSDASFAVLFALAAPVLAGGSGLLLEGNFRAGEHDPALRTLAAATRCAQVLCRAPEAQRLARLRARAGDPARHPRHGDASQAAQPSSAVCDAYLDIPGPRWLCEDDPVTLCRQIEHWLTQPG